MSTQHDDERLIKFSTESLDVTALTFESSDGSVTHIVSIGVRSTAHLPNGGRVPMRGDLTSDEMRRVTAVLNEATERLWNVVVESVRSEV